MEFKRKFGNRKQKNSKKGLFLVILLALAILFWYKAEDLINLFFGTTS
jgi:hypothetical protein